ncbi:hypothetical protein E2562_030538 [Oryza meyeriana var. granulata]|uniref:Retrotransposon gag domain-containing protein n=1 Tax=Oryza meyeriana var. granulata TaxID=110450 RepID=A0A6G1D998_9ORYZ|nr:hypothetical protein E2562_030538 [Oryza meyeriana var. granulata]
MELKRKEFLNLKQGDMPFMDILNRFNYLARYAPEEITTEARKVKLCRDRLNLETEYALSAHEIHSMKSLVDKALRVESSGKKLQEISQGLSTQHHIRNNRRFNGITAAVIKLALKVGQQMSIVSIVVRWGILLVIVLIPKGKYHNLSNKLLKLHYVFQPRVVEFSVGPVMHQNQLQLLDMVV